LTKYLAIGIIQIDNLKTAEDRGVSICPKIGKGFPLMPVWLRDLNVFFSCFYQANAKEVAVGILKLFKYLGWYAYLAFIMPVFVLLFMILERYDPSSNESIFYIF
jgi:hypothetical protein